MAASDYAQIVFDKNGNCVFPEFEIGGIIVEPYKTWLYLKSERFWNEEMGFSKPYIARICSGKNDILGLSFKVEDVSIKDNDGVPYHSVNLFQVRHRDEIYAGICCYAYKDFGRFFAHKAGIPEGWEITEGSSNFNPFTNEPAKDDFYFADCYPPNAPDSNSPEFSNWVDQKKTIDLTPYKDCLGLNSYCGVTQDMVDALTAWLSKNYEKDLALKISNNSNLKFSNQGDRCYFGRGETPIGETGKPIFHRLLGA